MRYEFRPVTSCDMCGGHRFRTLGMRLSASQGFRPRRAEGIAVPVKQCECGLIFAAPQPVPADISDHYGLPPEEYWTGEAGWSADYFAAEIDTAKRLLDFRPGMKALDVGVGQGKAFRSLSEAGFDVWGCEPSEPFRARAIEGTKLDAGRVQLAGVEEADYPTEFFDFVTFGAVLEHLYSPSLALERALGWLKPGGVIQAEVPSSRWLIAKLVNAYFRLMGTTYVTHLSPMHAPFHLFEFSLEAFRRNGRRLGYDIAEHRFAVCVVPFVPLKRVFAWLMDTTDTGMQLTVYLRRRER